MIKNKHLLRPYQLDCIAWLNSNNGVGLVSLEQGLGKTLVSIAYTTANNLKTLIVCPNGIRLTWEDEILRWSDRSYHMVNPGDKSIDFSKDYIIISYSQIHKFYDIKKVGRGTKLILKDRFREIIKTIDCIVCDESTKIKNPKTRITLATTGLKIPKRILLSGTPIANKPIDLFTQLNYLDEHTWNNLVRFRDRYITGYTPPGRYFFIATGTKNEKELAERIKPLLFRRRKEDVENLPPKIFNKIPLELSSKAKRKYDKALQSFKEFLQQHTDLTKEEIYKRLKGEILTKVIELKKICIEDKIESGAIEDLIETILENNPDDKIVIFSMFRDPIIKLHEQFKNSTAIYGGIDATERQKRIKQLQEDTKTKLFFATIGVASMGLTLTRASNAIFIDLPWTTSELAQCEARIHRLGSLKSVNIFYPIMRGRIEDQVYSMLQQKEDTIDTIIDGKKIKKTVNIKTAIIKQQIKNLL